MLNAAGKLVGRVAPQLSRGRQDSTAVVGGQIGFRAFSFLSAVWFAWKARTLISETIDRPESLVRRNDWISYILPLDHWRTVVLVAATFALISAGICLLTAGGRSLPTGLRIGAAVSALVVNSLQQTAGGISHWNYFVVLGLLFSVLLPVQRPSREKVMDVDLSYRLFHASLLTIYSLAGLWKLVHIALALASGSVRGTWLDSASLIETARTNRLVFGHRIRAEPVLEFLSPFSPVLFVLFAVLMTGAIFASLNRSALLIVSPLIFGFHLFNYWAFGADFRFTGLVALATLFPYEVLSDIRASSPRSFGQTLLRAFAALFPFSITRLARDLLDSAQPRL